jgi:hypothetical protein
MFLMLSVYAIPILLGVLAGAVLALVSWELWRSQNRRVGLVQMGTRGDVLLWLLVLAAFTLGAFIAYVLLGLHV